MPEPERDLEVSRILVALDASAPGMAAARAAAALAAALQAELEALFVEDINLLRLAGLPFAREVGFASAAGRALEFEALERMLRAQAARLERMLARAAEQAPLQYSLRVARGEVLGEALAQARGVDLLVLGRAGRGAGAGRLGGGGGPVAVLFEGGAKGCRALAAAARLAQGSQRELLLLIAAAEPRYRALREEAEQWLGRRGLAARCAPAGAAGLDAAARAARARRAQMLVMARPKSKLGERGVGALLDAVGCPVMLVN